MFSKSYYSVIILSLYVPNLEQKIWSMPNLCPKNKIQDGGRRHLNLFPVAIFDHCWRSTIERNQHTKFHEYNFLNPRLNYIIILNSRWRPSAMLDFPLLDCWLIYLRTLWFSITIQNLLQNFDRGPNYGPKTKFKMSAAAILNYFRWQFLIYCRLHTIAVNHHTKLHANISIHDWVIITL